MFHFVFPSPVRGSAHFLRSGLDLFSSPCAAASPVESWTPCRTLPELRCTESVTLKWCSICAWGHFELALLGWIPGPTPVLLHGHYIEAGHPWWLATKNVCEPTGSTPVCTPLDWEGSCTPRPWTEQPHPGRWLHVQRPILPQQWIHR
jgi:hypothetical protein